MTLIESIRAEFLRYKTLAERAIAQVPDEQLGQPGPNDGNSIAIIVWHLSGNMRSRFTDFLTSDGEKPWRTRDEEFEPRAVTRQDLLTRWESGWQVLLAALEMLSDVDLARTVTIRTEPMPVHLALHRSLAHTSYHVGQIVYLAHSIRGHDWTYLSIAPRQSEAFNAQMAGARAGNRSTSER